MSFPLWLGAEPHVAAHAGRLFMVHQYDTVTTDVEITFYRIR